MPSIRTYAEQLWNGTLRTSERQGHPFATWNLLEELADGVAFYKSFVNITAVKTDAGVVLIDTGSFHPVSQQRSYEKIRSWSAEPVHTAVYTHGHVDHAYGLPPFLREHHERGWKRPQIVAHHAIIARMQRYIDTSGYNTVINTRQFGVHTEWPTEPVYPSVTYDGAMRLQVGGREFHLFHARGETDDHTWVFLPRERVLCTGDLFIWAVPNAGNPQKVQRYCLDWCQALRRMAGLAPVTLLPGHGVAILGETRVRAALLDTAEYLESLYTQTVSLMNQGATVDELIHQVQPPAHLTDRPYLQPVYDEPEFIVRNVYRHLGGWYSGLPSDLKPALWRAQAQEIVYLAGGVEPLLQRAEHWRQQGNYRLAGHLIDWAALAAPDSHQVHALRAEIYRQRTETETSTMARGVFGAAARESQQQAEPHAPEKT
jgi:alkyl sulfatase BDS1-like metallo-beta-lactamase superfamily hydrolase